MESGKQLDQKGGELKSLRLRNFETFSINADHEVYSCTPFERIDGETYAPGKLSEYQSAIIQEESGMDYDKGGTKFSGRETSIAEKKGNAGPDFSVDIWLHSCYLIIVKSEDTGRYWLLHYDPLQSKNSTNTVNRPDLDLVQLYYRPNYCDLNPAIRYEEPTVQLQEGEKVKAIILHVTPDYNYKDESNLSKGNFDLEVFYERMKGHLNKDSVVIKSLRQKNDKDKGDQPDFDITFMPNADQLRVVRRHDEKVILDERHCFESLANEAVTLPKLEEKAKVEEKVESKNPVSVDIETIKNSISDFIKANKSPKFLFDSFDAKQEALNLLVDLLKGEQAIGRKLTDLLQIWLTSEIQVNGKDRKIEDIIHDNRFLPTTQTSTEKFIAALRKNYGDSKLAEHHKPVTEHSQANIVKYPQG